MCVAVFLLPKLGLTALVGGTDSCALYHWSRLCIEAFTEVRLSFVVGV